MSNTDYEFDYLAIYTANYSTHTTSIPISPWKHSRSTDHLKARVIKHRKMIKIINILIKMNNPDAEEVKIYAV